MGAFKIRHCFVNHFEPDPSENYLRAEELKRTY